MPRVDYFDGTEELRDRCPRCGDAFLAEHEDRVYCGKCGYTEFK
ncbi:MAG: 30S ribosomal protein S27ae [Halobacteriaceae archaeon]